MKKVKKASIVLALLMFFSASVVFADDAIDDDYTVISNKIGVILGVIAWIGYAIAVGILIFIGMKYMMSAAHERADVKKGLVNYVIGVIIIGSAALIANVVSAIAMTSNKAKDVPGMAKDIVQTGMELGNLTSGK